jgi:hypothetical protein
MKYLLQRCFMTLLLASIVGETMAQSVIVTVRLDRDSIGVGETTTLRVYGQVAPALRAASERIFSYYLDLLQAGGAAAIERTGLLRPVSDKDPRTSSSGQPDGPNHVGIFDTLLNTPGAGRDAPVELFNVPVRGAELGTVTFSIRPGTTVPALAADFLVAPAEGGAPFLGGNYSAASATLNVGGSGAAPRVSIAVSPVPNGPGHHASLTFSAAPGVDHFVEYRDHLETGAWQVLPGAPHNSGTVTDESSAPQRFYRIRISN